jgi:hypothetical protein
MLINEYASLIARNQPEAANVVWGLIIDEVEDIKSNAVIEVS